MSTQDLCPVLCMCVLSVWTKGYPFCSHLLCTTCLNQNVLALCGVCIALPWLSVLEHDCYKDSPDCRHEHPNYVPSFVPNNGPKCLINMLAHVCAYTLLLLQVDQHLVSSCLLLVFSFPQARVLHRRYHACMYMHEWARSCLRVYAHIKNLSCLHLYAHIDTIMPARMSAIMPARMSAIMPARICTHRCDRACAYMHT